MTSLKNIDKESLEKDYVAIANIIEDLKINRKISKKSSFDKLIDDFRAQASEILDLMEKCPK